MLKVRGVILSFFQLVLGISSKFTPDTINKDLRVFKLLLKEGFELCPYAWSDGFVAALMLDPSEADNAVEESGGKWDTIYLYGAWCLKIIFILLTKMVAVHVGFSEISIRGPSLE